MRKHETLVPPLALASSLPHRRPLSARFRLFGRVFAPAARPRRSFATYFFKYPVPSLASLSPRDRLIPVARSLVRSLAHALRRIAA